jgi:hypothetical protein
MLTRHIPFTLTEPRLLIGLGVLQGVLLWSLQLWLARSDTPWLIPVMVAVLTAPLVAYLTGGAGLVWRQRGRMVLVITLLMAALATYAEWMLQPVHGVTVGRRGVGGLVHACSMLLLGPIGLSLWLGWRTNPRGWDYPRLFALAWRNTMLILVVSLLVGLFWLVLGAGVMLMSSLGVTLLRDIILSPWFAIPATTTAWAVASVYAVQRAVLLENVQRFWLGLNSWLLPLLLVFAIMWILALPVVGLSPLLATGSAAAILLWFVALAIKFVNCAWQDGREPPAYPHWLARLIVVVWPLLWLLVLVAGWALAQRVSQYGWTEDRLWAGWIWLLALGYVAGYHASWLPRWRQAGWLASVGRTNVIMACVMVVGLLLLSSPLADPRRLAVASQVNQLRQGHITPQAFDYGYLRYRSGRWGLQALHELTQWRGSPARLDIARRASERWSDDNPWASSPPAASLTPAQKLAQVSVLPATATLPGDLAALLEGQGSVRSYRASRCLDVPGECTIWLTDIGNDGQIEALLLLQQRSNIDIYLLARGAKGWEEVGEYQMKGGVKHVTLMTAIAEGKISWVAPRWPDLMLQNQRLHLAPD